MKIINNLDLKATNLIENKKNINTDVDFKKLLLNSVDRISAYEKDANKLGMLLATGDIDNIHDVVIANQKAEIALQLGIEVKNKIMDAYREIMRIQV